MKVQIKNNKDNILPSKTRVGVLYKKHDEFYLRINTSTTVYRAGITFVRFKKDSTDLPTLVWLFDRNSFDALIEVGEPTLSV